MFVATLFGGSGGEALPHPLCGAEGAQLQTFNLTKLCIPEGFMLAHGGSGEIFV